MTENTNAIEMNTEELQRDLSGFLREIEDGKTIIIMKAGKPVAEVKPIALPNKNLRPFGLCAGEFTVPDDFDAPLPENIIAEFEGK